MRITNFFYYVTSCRMANIAYSFSPLASRIHGFSRDFFSDFSFKIPKNLMDSFRRSSEFYNKFPHLRPSYNRPFITTRFAKPIYPISPLTENEPALSQTDSYTQPFQIRPGFYNLPMNIKFTKPIYPPSPFTSKFNGFIRSFFSRFF